MTGEQQLSAIDSMCVRNSARLSSLALDRQDASYHILTVRAHGVGVPVENQQEDLLRDLATLLVPNEYERVFLEFTPSRRTRFG